MSDIVGSMKVDSVNVLNNLSSVIVPTENPDYFEGVSTAGPLMSHLFFLAANGTSRRW